MKQIHKSVMSHMEYICVIVLSIWHNEVSVICGKWQPSGTAYIGQT